MSAERATLTQLVVAALAAIFLFVPACRGGSQSARELVLTGQHYSDDGDIAGAAQTLQKAMDVARQEGDKESYFEAAVYMSMIYDAIGQQRKGYDLLQSLAYIETKNKAAFSSQYYYRLMAYYAAKLDHDYDKSLMYSDKSLELSRHIYPNDTIFVYTDLANTAETYMMAGDYAGAWRLVRQLEAAPPIENTLYLAETSYVHSALLMRDAQYDSACVYASRGLTFAQIYQGAFECELMCLNILQRIDSVRGDLAGYIAHRNEYEHRYAQMRGTEMSYNLAVIEQRHKVELLEQSHRRSQINHLMILSVALTAITALLAIIRSMRKTTRARQRIAQLEKQELDNAVFRERLENELLQLRMQQKERALSEAQVKNEALSVRLAQRDEGLSPTEKLRTLEMALRDRHGDFLEHVEQTFPQLTANDIRLMGFIRMGVKSPTIANVLGISLASVNTSRYRLRKKLGLAKDVDLDVYIRKLK